MPVQKYKPKRTPRILENRLADNSAAAKKSVRSAHDTVARSRKLLGKARELIEGVRPRKRA